MAKKKADEAAPVEKVTVVKPYYKPVGARGSMLIYYPGEYNATPELKAELAAADVLYKEPPPPPEDPPEDPLSTVDYTGDPNLVLDYGDADLEK